MEQARNIVAFHVSKPDGGWCYIWRNAPFLSKKANGGQFKWLTDGYYFWTDSDHFAHQWGEVAYQSEYAISQCVVEIPEDRLLDLVGDVNDQIFFSRLCERVKKALRKSRRPTNHVTVPAVIDWARKNDVLPHAAIKAFDCPADTLKVAFRKENKEKMTLPTRQQLCVFEGYENFFQNEAVIYPDEFKHAVENVQELQGRRNDEEATECRIAR